MTILEVGRNCWRREQATRAALLVDAAAYYGALLEVAERAEHSVRILGWDTETSVDLAPDPADGRHPAPLGTFLDQLVQRRPELQVHILSWDFSVLYALEREALSQLRFQGLASPRLHFRLDAVHPLGAAHHQKVVVVDDAVAFTGGLDLCRRRWDTAEHRAQDPRRVDPRGQSYPPFHDVQVMLEGPVAAALGELFRARWQRATGEALAPSRPPAASAWPPGVTPDFQQVPVAVVRSQPALGEEADIKEVEQLYLDAIGRAQRYIYLENQYFSSARVGAALEAVLARPVGPEVVMVLPCRATGWLERASMEVFVSRRLRQLQAADRHHRFGAFHPRADVQVHSKVCVIDGTFLRVGSSNLSNRSLGMDTECDVALEDDGSGRVAAGTRRCLARLLGEHLRVDPGSLEAGRDHGGSLLEEVRFHSARGAGLHPLVLELTDWQERLAFEPEVADPEMPLEREDFFAAFAPEVIRRSVRWRDAWLLVALGTLVALALCWRWTPLVGLVDVAALADWTETLRARPGLASMVLPLFVLLSLLMVPITALNFAAVVALGPAWGFLVATAGSLLSAAAAYGVGQLLTPRALDWLTRGRLGKVRSRILARGALTVFAARILPVGPYTLINLFAGKARVAFREFMVGTIMGVTPGIVAMVLLRQGLAATLLRPGMGSSLQLLAFTAVVVLGLGWAHRRVAGPRG